MKKPISIFAFVFILSSISFAQLTINDTLLLTFSNEIFWGSSSELEPGKSKDFGKFGSLNLADSNQETCWAEGSKGDGVNEFVWLTIPEGIQNLRIRNGYQKSESIYLSNNRAKDIEIELFACYEPSGYITETHNGFFISDALASTKTILKDSFGYQDVSLNLNWSKISTLLSGNELFDNDRFILKIKILSVYKGSKWEDACISDINIVPAPYYDKTIDDHGFLKVSENITDTLFYEPENIYQIIEVSPDQKWIIFVIMPSDIENSRVETIYKLYNTDKREFINLEGFIEMYGFMEKDDTLFIEGSNKDNEDISLQLEQ